MTDVEEMKAAQERLQKNEYLTWAQGGGPNECWHGIAAGIACRHCDQELVAKLPADASPSEPQDEPKRPEATKSILDMLDESVFIRPEGLRNELQIGMSGLDKEIEKNWATQIFVRIELSLDEYRTMKATLPADASPSEPQEQEKRPDAFDWWWNYARPFPESTTDGDMARAAWVAGRAALIAEMDKIHAGIKEAENCDDK